MKTSKKVKQKLFTKRKNGETETKIALDYLRMPKKLQEIFPIVAIVCFRYERLSLFCKMFLPLFCFEQQTTLKNFSKKLYTRKIKKKRKSRDEK